jgi:hypothetical protein
MLYVIHYELGDELEIRYVSADNLDVALEWANNVNNKPQVFDYDQDEWVVDYVAPTYSMMVPIAGKSHFRQVYFNVPKEDA